MKYHAFLLSLKKQQNLKMLSAANYKWCFKGWHYIFSGVMMQLAVAPLIALSSQRSTLINSFLASGNFCRLLITNANSLDPDQDQHFVGPDLNPNLFDTLLVFLKDFFEKS